MMSHFCSLICKIFQSGCNRRARLLRFVSHMLIVSLLAPAVGGAVYTFCEADWHDTPLLVRLPGSVVGGFVLLAFIWFLTIPLGLLTSALCLALRQLGLAYRPLWLCGGLVVGGLMGQFFALWAQVPAPLTIGSGVPVGAVTGLALREVWCRDKGEIIDYRSSPSRQNQ